MNQCLFLTDSSYSFFKTLVDHEVTVELKNDISIRGTLKSVDQFLNIKLDDIQVVEEIKYPHLVRNSSPDTPDKNRHPFLLVLTDKLRLLVFRKERVHQRECCALCPPARRSSRYCSTRRCYKARYARNNQMTLTASEPYIN